MSVTQVTQRGVLALGLLALGALSDVHGQEPELVAPGVISTDGRHETFPALDPVDGSLWLSVYTNDFDQQTILRAERAGDGWAPPEVVTFSGRWGDRAPRFTPDGRRLYFTSHRRGSADIFRISLRALARPLTRG